MQGSRGQGDDRQNPLDRSATTGFRRSDLTGPQSRLYDTSAAQRAIEQRRQAELTGEIRALPKRPGGMAHLDQPPQTPRVARPQSSNQRKPTSLRKRLLIWGIVLVIGVPLLFGLAYGATNFFSALSVTAGAASKADDFLSSLKSADYNQAWQDLNEALTYHMDEPTFAQNAQANDHCYGQVTDYKEVQGSGTVSADGNTQSYSYDMTRVTPQKTYHYQMRLTLQKDATGDWSITSYGGQLGPAAPTCK